jgi:hypothetical protein
MMETPKDDYLTVYRGLKLSRDAEVVLVDLLHANGGPSTFTAEDHTAFVDAFYRITQDRANKIVMLTCVSVSTVSADRVPPALVGRASAGKE